jgi:ABC-type dipeptide/oligopeptide/nickel transport system permease subunit
MFIIILFIGYLLGRIGDYYAGHWDFFHHWIYGVILIIPGILIHEYLIWFGIGLIISDLKDMLELKIFGPDEKEIKRFWGID